MHTEEEFKYLMKFHNINSVPIYYQGTCVGEVDANMQYTHKRTLRYLTSDIFAKQLAEEQIDGYLEKVMLFRSSDTIKTNAEYCYTHDVWEYADKDGIVRHHVYPHSITDIKSEEWEGTYDALFERMEKENNHLRYCNGMSWRFADQKMRELYRDWDRFIPESRSFSLYYGNGVVD